MTQFHEGEEVEVFFLEEYSSLHKWRKAKIVASLHLITDLDDGSRLMDTYPSYEVQFPDGTRAVFDARHIRAIKKN